MLVFAGGASADTFEVDRYDSDLPDVQVGDGV